MLKSATAALAVFLCLGAPTKADAPIIMATQLRCDLTEQVESDLHEFYHEVVIAQGVGTDGRLIRIFSSGKTFTVIRTDPGGISCTIEEGSDWDSHVGVPGDNL